MSYLLARRYSLADVNNEHSGGDDMPTDRRRRRREGRGRRRYYERKTDNMNGATNETTEIQSQDWPAETETA